MCLSRDYWGESVKCGRGDIGEVIMVFGGFRLVFGGFRFKFRVNIVVCVEEVY